MTKTQFLLLSLAVLPMSVSAHTFSIGLWTVGVDNSDGAVTIAERGDTIVNRSIAGWGTESALTTFKDCHNIKATVADGRLLSDDARIVTVNGIAPDATEASLSLSFPQGKPYFTAQLYIKGAQAESGVDCMEVINTTAPVQMPGADNRQLSVPYDNDAWVRYSTAPFGEEARESYEVGAMFDAASRRGLVAGSIDHDLWKSAVRYTTTGKTSVDNLTLYSGASSSLTRDVRRHGLVKGSVVASPRFMIMPASDWRVGMETFADVCAAVAPNRTKGGARPFGWNSWGDLQTKINYQNACEVSDFIHDNLAGSFFSADSSVIINLDAFWDFGLNEEQHHKFVAHCRANGQKPAIYYCPFTDWGKNQEVVIAEAPQYKMGDLYLRYEGNPIEFDGAPALDPTHPGTRARIERQLNQFIDWGYEYVKIDFMAHGAYESDTHFDPSVTTGTRAFCSGMEFIDSVADGRLWINLSIAPVFPACYAQSRRIGCDAWSDMGSTEYTLNALTYGWWLDHLYHYNDADHIVFKGVTEGENRARLLSSAITGVFFLGDDMSATGDSLTHERIKRYANVARINDMARRTKSFRPLRPGDGDRASDIFEGSDANTRWVAVFNYGDEPKPMAFSMWELGIDPASVTAVTELWSGSAATVSGFGSVAALLPPKDAMIFEIELDHNR